MFESSAVVSSSNARGLSRVLEIFLAFGVFDAKSGCLVFKFLGNGTTAFDVRIASDKLRFCGNDDDDDDVEADLFFFFIDFCRKTIERIGLTFTAKEKKGRLLLPSTLLVTGNCKIVFYLFYSSVFSSCAKCTK